MSAQVSRITNEGVQSGPIFTDRAAADAFASIYQAVAHSAGRVEVLTVSEMSDPHPPAVGTG